MGMPLFFPPSLFSNLRTKREPGGPRQCTCVCICRNFSHKKALGNLSSFPTLSHALFKMWDLFWFSLSLISGLLTIPYVSSIFIKSTFYWGQLIKQQPVSNIPLFFYINTCPFYFSTQLFIFPNRINRHTSAAKSIGLFPQFLTALPAIRRCLPISKAFTTTLLLSIKGFGKQSKLGHLKKSPKNQTVSLSYITYGYFILFGNICIL